MKNLDLSGLEGLGGMVSKLGKTEELNSEKITSTLSQIQRGSSIPILSLNPSVWRFG